MAADVVPVLLETVKVDFNERVAADKTIQRTANRIRDGTATLVDAHDYAVALGENLSAALLKSVTPEALPDGRLYFNIADRLLKSLMQDNFDLSTETSVTIQGILDKKLKIGLNAIRPEFPAERVRGLADKASGVWEDFNSVRKWLGEPVVNTSQSFFDEFVRSNADFRSKAGVEVRIVRTLGAHENRTAKDGRDYAIPCDWCQSLAGVYPYEQVRNTGNDVYRRHEYCRCAVTYENGLARQNVWTKKTWQAPAETLEARKTIGLDSIRR